MAPHDRHLFRRFLQLVVGTSGAEIKLLKSGALLREILEGDPTIALCTIEGAGGTFAYGLQNGVVGVYRRWERLWRVKTKHQICALVMFPRLGVAASADDEPPSAALTCVWRNGKVGEQKGFKKAV